jgi:hypothetical protein
MTKTITVFWNVTSCTSSSVLSAELHKTTVSIILPTFQLNLSLSSVKDFLIVSL